MQERQWGEDMRKALIGMAGAALAMGLAAPAGAVVTGPSNFGLFVYPSHNCGPRPVQPFRPPDFRSYTEAQDFNIRIEQYNRNLLAYSDCINAYVERTRLDSLRIRERADDAIRDVR